MMRNFAAVEKALLEDAALAARTHLLTVSFDPRHDTPDVLRSFGLPFQRTKPPFTHWTLATGKEEAIGQLARALELDYVEESGSFTHNLRTAVIGPEGRLVRLFRGNDWKPAELGAYNLPPSSSADVMVQPPRPPTSARPDPGWPCT